MIPDGEIIEVFKKFHAFRHESADKFVRDKIIRHSDFEFPGRTHTNFRSLIFFEMAENFTRGLISELNRFLLNINHADCWFQAAQQYEESERAGLLWEFADPHIELSVSRPYSLKNHFIFAAVYLLHYSNQLKNADWKDDLPPDDRINFKLLDNVGSNWTSFQKFKEGIELLHNKEFQDNTCNFRHRLQHRYRSHFDFGLTSFFDRIKTENGMTYALKVIPPLDLLILIPALYKQHQLSVEVFQTYWRLVGELCGEWDKKHAKT
jgi:hypothetical protein